MLHLQFSPSQATLPLQSPVPPYSPSSPWLQGSALLRIDQHVALPTAIHLQCPINSNLPLAKPSIRLQAVDSPLNFVLNLHGCCNLPANSTCSNHLYPRP